MMEWNIEPAKRGLTIATIEYNERQLKVVYRDGCSDIIIKEGGEVARHVTHLGTFSEARERAFEVEQELRATDPSLCQSLLYNRKGNDERLY